MNTDSYPPPIDLLLVYGDCRNFREWPNYLEHGLGLEHVPDLIRMATDDDLNWADSDSLEVWAPTHAWRALGQLRAEAAIEPLLRLFHELEDSDWVGEEMPVVYGMIGSAAIPALSAYLADESHGLYPRITATHCLEQIGTNHPEARHDCVTVLTRQLELFEENDETLNGFLISYLLDLKATESVPLVERAFAADCVDETVAGDWDDVQVELGLKEPSEIKRKPWFDNPLAPLSLAPDELSPHGYETVHPRAADAKDRAKAKAKRKQAKASRKRNRRRK